MAFTYQEPDSPFGMLMAGMSAGQNMFEHPYKLQQMKLANALNEYKRQQMAEEAKYYGPVAKANADVAILAPQEHQQKMAEITQQMQANPELWKSRMALEGAQTGKLGKETQWYDREMQAKMAQQQVATEEARAKQQFIQQILARSGMTPSSGQAAPLAQPNAPIANAAQGSGMSYPEVAYASHLLGLGKPEIIDVDGTKVAVSPLGNTVIAQGLNPLQKEMTKEDAKHIGNMETNVLSGTIKQETLNDLANIVVSPEFEAMRQNPMLGKYELLGYSRFGNKAQKEMVGKYMALTGQIIKDSARDFSGQFRIGEQALLNSMKPSLSDTAEVARGKIESLSIMNRMLTERSRITSELMRERGMSLPKAMEQADKLIDSKSIREEITNKLKPKYDKEMVINGKRYIQKGNEVYEL